MGDKDRKPFQLSFNGFLKVDFQGSRVTSDGGLLLVRELDERLGLGKLIDQHLSDTRQGENKKFPLAGLVRQSVYSRLSGYEDLNDAVGPVHIMDCYYVWVIEGLGGLGFAYETFLANRIGDFLSRQDLDGDEPVQVGITGLIHNAHAALAELVEDFVVGDALADHRHSITGERDPPVLLA